MALNAKFCDKCGTQAPVAETASRSSVEVFRSIVATQPNTQVSAAKSGGGFRKLAIAGVVTVLLLAVAVTGSMIYVAHRVKRKVAEVEAVSHSASADDALKLVTNAAKSMDASSSSNRDSNTSHSKKPEAPYGWMDDPKNPGKLIPVPSPFVPIPTASALETIVPVRATGNQNQDWTLKYERTENGPEADLVVRTGDINNLGFGWPQGFDPFSGQSTPPHQYPWVPRSDEPDGTDRILLGSIISTDTTYLGYDGYSGILRPCENIKTPPGQICKVRLESMPTPIRLEVGELPSKVNDVVVQMFVDDFQAKNFHSYFQVSLNGTRLPNFEYAINSLDQTGPIGKLVTLKLLPEYWPLLRSGEVKLLIDDPTTKIGDGYAVDFVRILVNPHKFKYEVSLAASVVDADQHTPIANATVTAALKSASTERNGKCQLMGLPAGLVTATALADGYDENSVPVDLIAGQNGSAEIQLHRHHEDTATLEKELAQTGSATIYGIHFDTDSAKLRPDSMPALNAVLGLINNHPGSQWVIAGHTDNQGNADHNQALSKNRSASVIAWLKDHGVNSNQLDGQGFGASRPVADNTTPNGRALNRRVEVALTK
ncbi:MAG TPA: OmpA family protein [Candidatus Eisenbacteria bacterium]|nr:OmpA family protein [Candidatus Eisenbacteria bacterium]